MKIQDLHDTKRKALRIIFLGNATITGTLKCETGLHIGGGNDELKIGGIDKFVIKTPDNKPYIPGSSFKGKTRSLFEKWLGKASNRKGADKIYRYEAENIDDALSCELSRIFGATSQGGDALNFPSRLIVRDFSPKTFKLEKKSENTLDRLSAHANPRTNERVASGSEFKLQMEYNLEVITDGTDLFLGNDKKKTIDTYLTDTIEDLKNIFNCLILLEHSYLGGNGSRGYGQVKFQDLNLEIKTAKELLESTITKHNTITAVKNKNPREIRDEIAKDEKKKEISESLKLYYQSLTTDLANS